jgi:hypothetical protein
MRIRSIRPEFWRSDDIDRLDWPTRLLFIGLWSYVDDNGVGRDRESDIAADLFSTDLSRDPRETLARVADGLQHLANGGQIVRYTVEGRAYFHVTAWEKHQKIDRPNKDRYPLPTSTNAVTRETLDEPSRVSRETPSTGEGEKGRRGEEFLSDESDAPDLFDEFWKHYPRREAKAAARKAWDKAIKKVGPQEILDGLTAHAFSPDPQYRPLPASWLNAGRWEDEASVHQLRPADPHAGKTKYAEMSPGVWQECHPEGFYMGKRVEWR